jgi:hypothetical protein
VKFDDLKGWFRGESCVVVGDGPSAHELAPGFLNRYWTIACNRAVNLCRPDFAACFEPYGDPVWPVVLGSGYGAMFTHRPEWAKGKPTPRAIVLPSLDVATWLRGEPGPKLELAMSTFWSVAVAAWLGFDTIAMIGLDLTADRWPDVSPENEAFDQLHWIIRQRGSRMVNLNRESRMVSVPWATWDDVPQRRLR